MGDFKQNIQLIYNALRREGYTDIGSVDDFTKSMQDEGNRKKVFNALHSSGYTDIGKDFNAFSGMIYEAPKPVQQPAQQQAPAKADPFHVDATVKTEVAAQQQPKSQQQPKAQQQSAPQSTIKLPSFKDIAEQSAWKPAPIFETETSIDKDGNRVSTARPMPVFKNGKVVNVYKDMLTGKEYEEGAVPEQDAKDFERGMKAANRKMTYDNVETIDPQQQNRLQVDGLMQNIDAQLQDAYKVAQKKHADAKPSFWMEMLHDLADASHGAGPIQTDNAYETLVKNDTDVRALHAAKNSLKDAKALIAEADKSVKEGNFDGFFSGAGRGFGNKLFDARTWDMGLADSQDAGAILSALGDFDAGKKLTPAQQTLLDAKAVELATNAYFGSYIGRGYKAGGVTAESIPFMIEMCINPASGAGNGAQSMLTRYALKRFGKEAIKKNAKKYLAGKVTTRVAGDIAGSAAMAATTGSIHTLADAQQRMAGDVQFDIDEQGNSVFSGHTEGDDAGKAFAKAFANTTIENYSEMFGEYFAPVLKPITSKAGGMVSRGMEKVGLSKVNDFISHVGASDVAKIVTDFEKHSKWNGVFGEYAEEVAGNIMNATIVGDMTMDNAEGTGVFNLDQNIDTFLGVSLMGGFMSTVKATGYRTPKYRQRQAMTAADDAASTTFGNQDTWGSIRNTVAFGNDQERHDKLVEVLTSDDYTPAQKQAAMQYAKEVEKYRGMQQAEQKRRSDENSNPLQTDAETSFDNGYSLASAQEMNDAKNMLDYRSQKMQEEFGISEGDIATILGDDPVAAIDAMRETHSPEQIKAATDYLNAKATWDGMITHVQDDIADKESKSNAEIDARVNKTTGMVQPATMKYQDRKVYIVGGNVAMMDDGSMVDVANSDESVIIRDAETGKVEMVSPADIFNVEQAVDPVEEKERAKQEIRESVAQEAANNIDGTLAFGENDTYTILDDDGQQHNVTIVQATDENGQPIELPQGQVAVSIDGAEPTIMPADAIQQGADQYNLARLQEHEQQQVEAEAAIAEQEHEATRPVYELNDEVTLRDDNGLPVRGSITAAENEDGLIEVWTESPISGNKVNMFTRDQLDDMLMQHNGEEVEQPVVEETGESVHETGESVHETGESVHETGESVPVSEPVDEAQQRAIDRIPSEQVTDGKGNTKTVRQWEQAEPADTFDALNETYGDEQRTKKKIGKRIDNLDKQIKAVQKQIDKLDDSDDFDADINNEDGYQQLAQQKAALEAQKRYWQSVQRVPQDRINEANKLDEEARKKAQAEREAAEAAAAEQARIDRERTNGVPDMVSDKPADARSRGFRNVNGQVVERQQQTEGVVGRESNVKFSDKDTVKGRIKVIEASQLQPSHVNGVVNTQHFIPEAQPKNRTDQVSDVRAGEIAANINPEEITGDGSAYQFSAPTTNTRGEVIQGNNRGDALRRMWADAANEQSQQAYKQYLIDHADEFGLDAQAIAAMQQPVMVNEVNVDDNEAIRLGQLKSSNNESGGIERIDPINTARTLGSKMSNYANVLLGSTDEEASLSELIASNSGRAISWLSSNGFITPTQVGSAYDTKGNVTEEAKADLRNILKQSLFQGGVNDLPAMFDAMPAKAQKAILTTFMRDFDSTEDNRILGEIQQAIEVWYHAAHTFTDFAAAKTYEQARGLMEGYKRQTNLLDDNMPTDVYSPFSFELACRMQVLNMKTLQQYFNDFFDLVQGKSIGDLFNEGEAGEFVPMVEAIKRVFNVDFTTNNSENNDQERSDNVGDNATEGADGRQGEQGNAQSGEQDAPVEEPAKAGAGTESNAGEEVKPSNNNLFQYFTGSLSEMIARAKQSATDFAKKIIAPVSSRLKQDLEAQGVALDGEFNHVIDNSAIRHTLKQHGGKNEEKRGQIPVTEADFERIPEVVNDYDEVKVEKGKRDALNLIYSKTYEDGTTVFVEEKRDKRQELAAVTMWKQKSPTLTDANRENTTPISDLSRTSEDKDTQKPATPQEKAEKGAETHDEKQPTENNHKLVSTERYEELKKRLRAKLGQLNMGIDPEIIAIGSEMAVYHIEGGARKFVDYAKAMIVDVGDVVRPYLKSFYNAVRDMPEAEQFADEMTPYDEVRQFNVATIGENGEENQPTVIETAEQVSNEQTVQRNADEVEVVESQLALLGYYEGEEVAKDFNEAYGYLRNAEKKAVNDALQLAKKIAKYLGLVTPKKKDVRSNIAPIGGDVHFSLPLDDTHNLYFNFQLDRDEDNYDNLKLKGIMFRVENSDTNVRDRGDNNFLPTNSTFEDMMKEIRRALKYAMPEFVVPEKSEKEAQNADNKKGNEAKTSKSKKKAVTSRQEAQTNLFGDLFGSADVNENDNENDTAEPRSDEAEGNTNRTVGDVPADGNGVLEPESTGATDRGNSDAAGTGNERLADGEPQGLSTDGSRGGSTERNNVAGEEQSDGTDGGRSVSTGDAEDGRRSTGETSTGSRKTTKRDSDRRIDDGSKKTANERNNPKNTRNYLYGKDAEEIDNMSEKQRLATNVEALETLVQVLREKRDATAEERALMGKFRGWGGIDLSRFHSQRQLLSSNAHTSQYNPETGRYETVADNYQRLGKVLNELDPDEKRGIYKDIRHASLTSYYTPLPIARAMNDYLVQAGYKGGGNLLDPSMGTGIFEGTLPKDVQQRTNIYGVELDWLTAQLAKQLYPDAHVENNGFEKAELTAGAYDIVESNIPFGDISVDDAGWRRDSSPVRKAAMGRIHNYFAVKMMEMAKVGGLVTIMTSNAIMDTKGNAIIRKELLRHGEFLGAIRLPNNVFKGAGTAVVTDVIFMRKYRNEEDSAMTNARPSYKERVEQFNSSATMRATNKDMDVPLNGYFAANPKMMIGDVVAGGQYREDEFGLTSKEDANAIAKKMTSLIKKQIVGDRAGNLYDTTKPEREVQQAIREAYVGDGNYNSAGNIVEQNGKYGVLNVVGRDGELMFEENPELKKNADRIKLYIPVRTAFKKLTAAQINRESDATIKKYRKELNDTYNAFVKKYGQLNDKANNFIEADIDSYQMRGLEEIDSDTGKVKKLADIFTKNTIKPTIDMESANNPSSAIATCLAGYGEIRTAFMEKVLGENWREQCHGTLYRLPNSENYVVADDYLSGDVKTKLEEARAAAALDEAYQENVDALEKVQPRDLMIGDINIRMGARWVSDKTYTDFLREMFGMPDWGSKKSQVRYVPEADEFLVEVDKRELGGEADRWATDHKSAKEIFEAAMKDKTLQVWNHHSDGSVTLNKEETQLANDKVQELRETFETWVGSDPERGEQLASVYNDKFNRTVIRKWNGDFLDPVGLQGITLRAHQKAAVWMLLNNRGGIVDHIVGAGKTLVMQSTIMEMRRMGIAKKPMILALKATCSQIAKEFSQAYPSACILAPTEKDFSAKNRKKLLAKIASNDYDCVIISHEQYTQLPHTQEIETQTINEQLEQLDAAIMLMRGAGDKSQLTKRQLKGLEKRKANLETKMQKMLDRKVDREFCFENLGVDYLFVDECQQFKGLPYATTYNQVAGLGDPQGSQRAVALLNGVRYLQQLHQGDRGTVFLSGTTITNTLVEVYNLLNYLRPNMMQKLGYTTFDAWAAQYAVKSADLEYGVTNELKTKTRFRSFQNVSELGKLYAEIADVRNDMNLELPKPKPNSHLVKVPATPLQEEINREVVSMVQNKNGDYFGITSEDDRKAPWSLHASRISEMSAIDPRLIFPDAEDEGGGKVPVVCESVAKLYKQFDKDKGTQLIFCDKGIPDSKKGYDVYTDIINRLVNEYGIPRSEIVDIHTANTDQKRKALFKKVNEGTVRILIGGTKNMGTGVNVQKRLIAEHHLDMPWTPADREQREGRAVRQGNWLAKEKNGNKVELFYYATEGSLDMYKYQLQEIKGKMFAQFKTNTIDADASREFDEGSDAEGSIDPAEMVAILSGNPVIFEKSKQDKLVKKLRRQEAAERSDYVRRKKNYEQAEKDKQHMEELLRKNRKDVAELTAAGFVKDDGGTYPNVFQVTTDMWGYAGRSFDKAKDAGKYIHDALKEGKDVRIKGYNVTAKVEADPNADGDLFARQLVIESIGRGNDYGERQIRYSVKLSDDDTAAGMAFRNLLERVIKNGEVYQRKLDEANHKLQGADKLGEYKFSKQEQLDEAIERKKELDAEYQLLSDDKPESESGENEDNNRYRIREAEPPKKTGIGYKVFVLKNGKLYPPMVANPNGADTPTGVWLDADAAPVAGTSKTGRPQVKAGGKGTQGGSGKLAYRPGWHLGVIPFAKQFARLNPDTGERELFPNNFVWAEVEYAADNDYQQEAHDMGLNENGKYVHSLAGLKHLPTDGFYMYRTNVDPTTDPWVITGAMKVNRLLTPTEVDKMVKDAGREPQARQEGAVTDEQINALNKEIAERNATDAESIAKAAKKTGKKLGTKVRIVENVEELTDKDARKQKRMRRAKGWYDTATGEVVVVVPNADNVADVVATVLHEVVGHEGLRKVVGAQHFDNFLRKVYERSNRATRAAINALAAKNGWNFSLATEEYIAEMAESGFNNRENLGTWERIKQFFKDMLSADKIAVGIDINDNDLRYMLWRSYQMQQSRGAMGVAEDIAMQQQLGVGNYADTNRYRNGGSLPTDDVTDVVKGLRQEYDEAMKKSGFQVQEAIQDSMLSLKKLMDILQKHSGKAEIADWENAYTAENALSSRNKAEQDEFKRKYYNPLMEAMRALKDDMTEEEIGDYVMAKHGIERNREMSVRAALTDDGSVLDKTMLAKWNKRKDDVRNDTSLPTWRDKQEALDEIAVNEFGADLYARDYSGLTSLYQFDDVEDAVNTAYGVVDDVEWRNPTATEKLGNAIKNANAATLEKLFTSGMINRETKESIAQMYDYYVPLRGFDETTSEEVYAYVRDERKSFNNPLKRAKGRSSKADNPFAHILSMADSAILQGNKNLMKQKFLNFVLNRPSDLVSVSDMWIKKDPVTDEWVTAFPTIPDDATPEEVADIVRQFNEDMQTEVDNGNPDIKRIKGKTADVPYRTLHDQISSHQVIVKRDGKEYVMTINANPRAAMALNGQTNPHSDYKGVGGAFKRSADYINRQLAGWYTTKNPDFVASNFVRDALYSNSMVWVKESPRYAVRFHKNFVKFNPKKMGKLFHKFNNGTLDMSDPVEKEFYRFMMNGGETGYSNLKDIEELKKELTKDLKNTKLHQMKALLDRFDIINRSVENCARFAAYMSSREEERSVQRAVFDAKEISVNFNKKGAGGTFFGAVGQTKLGSMAAGSSAACRALYVFFNAGVQGTTNILRAAKHNKKKFGTLAASYFILGYLAPMLMGGGDGDDDDKFTNYDDLPDYVRRTNLIIPIGSSYISLPLPIEFRTMYGMGELASNVLSGKERYTGTQLARTMAEQVTQALPINFLDGEGTGVLSPFVPSAVAPLYQAHENMDWTGMPIYKDNDYNKKKPEYTKAFGRTNRHLVNLAEGLNNATGGDEFSKGAIDLNPALVEHIVQGYFGGAVTFLNKMSNSIDMATGEMEPDWRNVPIANRLVKSGSVYTKQRAINREYFSNLDQWEEIQQREKGYIGKLQSPKLSLEEKAEWAEKLEDLHKSDEWQNMQVFNFLNKQVKKMGELQKAMPQENPELARDIWHLKRQANEVARGEFDDESK